VDELRNPKRDFVRVAFARGIQPPKNMKDADGKSLNLLPVGVINFEFVGIMDWLDQRKIIEMEWVKVKDMMEIARNLDMAAKKGEED